LSTEQNKRIAAEYLDAVAIPDVDRAMALLHDDAACHIIGKPELFPMAGQLTKSALRKLISDSAGLFDGGMKITITGTTAEGDRVAVEAFSNGSFANGRKYNNTYHFLFVIRDGKIHVLKEYFDTQHAAYAFGI